MELKRVLLGAFGYVFEYKAALLTRTVPLILLSLGSGYAFGVTDSVLIKAPAFAINVFAYVLIAVNTHRIILLGAASTPSWGIYLPMSREWLFLGFSILSMLAIIPVALLALIPLIGKFLMIPLMVLVIGRISLVFPAIATDQKWSLRDSWDATSGHSISMMVVVGLFPFVLGIPQDWLSQIPYTSVFVVLLSSIAMVLTIAALSVSFKELKREYGHLEASK